MTQNIPSDSTETSNSLCTLGLKTHRLLQRSLEAGLHDEVQTLLYINDHFLDVWAKANEAAQREATQQQEAGYTHYIWRTSGDNRVRSAHAQNEGRIFAWGSPPPTGHPGEDFGCRCKAEAYKRGETEYVQQTFTSNIFDNPDQRSNADFIEHFYLGGGRGVTLSETGHLRGVINHYFYTHDAYNRVNQQIIEEAVSRESGSFAYSFWKSYEFGSYLFAFGRSVVSGMFTGTVKHEGSMMFIEGSVQYAYTDVFTDPASIRQWLIETSDPEAAWATGVLLSDGFGTYFTISDTWRTHFVAEVRLKTPRT